MGDSARTPRQFRAGDVISYTTLTRPNRWCREGTALGEMVNGTLMWRDTFWSYGGQQHVLTDDEVATGTLVFNVHDYEKLDESTSLARSNSLRTWEQHHPDDRAVLTSQHGLVISYYLRKGAKPDLDTQIDNAKEALVMAKAEADAAQRAVARRQEELASLLEKTIVTV